jgi:hypothetical protein
VLRERLGEGSIGPTARSRTGSPDIFDREGRDAAMRNPVKYRRKRKGNERSTRSRDRTRYDTDSIRTFVSTGVET